MARPGSAEGTSTVAAYIKGYAGHDRIWRLQHIVASVESDRAEAVELLVAELRLQRNTTALEAIKEHLAADKLVRWHSAPRACCECARVAIDLTLHPSLSSPPPPSLLRLSPPPLPPLRRRRPTPPHPRTHTHTHPHDIPGRAGGVGNRDVGDGRRRCRESARDSRRGG